MKQCLIILLALIVAAMSGIFLWLLPAKPEAAAPTESTAAAAPTAAETQPQTLPPQIQPLPEVIDTVPLYYQTDYPYVRYGNGTLGSSGCSMACLAMAATYVTDQVYTPEMLAYAFGSYGSTNVQRLDHAIAEMQLPCEKNTDWRITKEALRSGKIAIVLMDERSLFTNSAHFVLVAGINREGRYLVHDPFEPNYREDYLREGFRQGFTETQLLAGLEGSWVFDKSAMGDFRYEIILPESMPTRYSNYRPSDPDVETLARFVWAAARQEDAETQQAVAELVLNRMISEKYPDRVEDVMGQEELYIWYRQLDSAQPTVTQYQAVTTALYGPYILPPEVVHGAPWPVGGGEEWGTLGSFHFSYERDSSINGT